jgi:4-diphosphocytidyl-2-C-methyl-D-erythritol kinase
VSAVAHQSVTARAPAKINLVLRVGLPDDTGYHPLVTVFQAVDIWDEVTVEESAEDRLTIDGVGDLSGVPTNHTNIVWRAVEALCAHTNHRTPLHIHLSKQIPVAGGMAGGSADAAATLVAVSALWSLDLSAQQLHEIAARLGADVPFSLLGGLALGQARGDVLTPLERTTPLHVVIARSPFELSTPTVYRELDRLRETGEADPPRLEVATIDTVGQLSPAELAEVIANDLDGPARHLQPEIDRVLDAVKNAGAMTSLVSGSGPTVWGLCDSAENASEVALALASQGIDAVASQDTPRGAELVTDPSSPTAAR